MAHEQAVDLTGCSIAVLGLGPMGSALARTMARVGAQVVAWTRSARVVTSSDGRMIKRTATAASAVAEARVVLVCVADYLASRGILEHDDVRQVIPGRTVVQLSTGRPTEARAMAAWVREHEARYLDGAILVTPSQIATPEAAILVAGDAEAWADAEAVLRQLAPALTYVGDDPGAAAALDLAFLSHFFGGLLGFYHGARIMEAEGLPVGQLGDMIAEVAPALGQMIAQDAGRIAASHFSGSESTLNTCAVVTNLIQAHAAEAGLDQAFSASAAQLFNDAMAKGWGSEDAAAVVKLLRQRSLVRSA
jgi:3-hydroxyisobutyrate dehydrogenase-like beta-hydroxyacid dehydrogenase